MSINAELKFMLAVDILDFEKKKRFKSILSGSGFGFHFYHHIDNKYFYVPQRKFGVRIG